MLQTSGFSQDHKKHLTKEKQRKKMSSFDLISLCFTVFQFQNILFGKLFCGYLPQINGTYLLDERLNCDISRIIKSFQYFQMLIKAVHVRVSSYSKLLALTLKTYSVLSSLLIITYKGECFAFKFTKLFFFFNFYVLVNLNAWGIF